jgi:hypothetical protein
MGARHRQAEHLDAERVTDAALERGAGGRRRRRDDVPLLRALGHPTTLVDRFVLAYVLGPPRSRARFELPALRALTRRVRARRTGDDDG